MFCGCPGPFFFFVGVGLGFFGVSGAVATGVAAGVPSSPAPANIVGIAGPAPSAGPLPFAGALSFFFAALADALGLSTCPRGPSLVCTAVGGSSGSITGGSAGASCTAGARESGGTGGPTDIGADGRTEPNDGWYGACGNVRGDCRLKGGSCGTGGGGAGGVAATSCAIR